MSNKQELRGVFLNHDDHKEEFELPNGMKFLMEPQTMQDVADWQKNRRKLDFNDDEAKDPLEMTIELIIRRTYDFDGDKLFGPRDKDDLMNSFNVPDSPMDKLIEAFNEVNGSVSANEEGELDTDFDDVNGGSEGK
jgi:hypothetical protein